MKRKVTIGFVVCFITVVSVLVYFPRSTASGGEGWLSGWAFRKAHVIMGSTAGEQFNYPVMINVRYGNGTDYGGRVYLGGKCRSDFGDVRFTDSTGSDELSYYIEQETNAAQALFWVSVNYISPRNTTIYIYYGNSSVSTTSNKAWTFDLCSDFEDETNQGWRISWGSNVVEDGVTTVSPFEGYYSREAGREYGSMAAGVGDFYESYYNSVFLNAGSYKFSVSTEFLSADHQYFFPIGVNLYSSSGLISNVSYTDAAWHLQSGNFTVSSDSQVNLEVEFHIFVFGSLWNGGDSYLIDSVIVRKWCNPEPTHGSWSVEQSFSSDTTPPQIFLVAWIPTSPYPFVQSSVPRQGEPILVMANVSDEVGGSGLDFVGACFRIAGGEWCNVSMTFNETTGFWNTIMPGELGNCTLEFFVVARDNAGNVSASGIDSSNVVLLIPGDVNGDGTVNILDSIILANHFLLHNP